MWLAGGGVKGGQIYGATDEFGFQAAENPVHVHDLHATILKLLGFDHERLTYRYAGRDFRLTDVHGKVIEELIAYKYGFGDQFRIRVTKTLEEIIAAAEHLKPAQFVQLRRRLDQFGKTSLGSRTVRRHGGFASRGN